MNIFKSVMVFFLVVIVTGCNTVGYIQSNNNAVKNDAVAKIYDNKGNLFQETFAFKDTKNLSEVRIVRTYNVDKEGFVIIDGNGKPSINKISYYEQRGGSWDLFSTQILTPY
jgi:hypothetical protein